MKILDKGSNVTSKAKARPLAFNKIELLDWMLNEAFCHHANNINELI